MLDVLVDHAGQGLRDARDDAKLVADRKVLVVLGESLAREARDRPVVHREDVHRVEAEEVDHRRVLRQPLGAPAVHRRALVVLKLQQGQAIDRLEGHQTAETLTAGHEAKLLGKGDGRIVRERQRQSKTSRPKV